VKDQQLLLLLLFSLGADSKYLNSYQMDAHDLLSETLTFPQRMNCNNVNEASIFQPPQGQNVNTHRCLNNKKSTQQQQQQVALVT